MSNLHLVTGFAGTEHVTAEDVGSFNAATFGAGQYVLDRGNKFTAQIISNNKVRIKDGDILMQGRHLRLQKDTYEDCTFENGTQGYKRHDLIVVRYTKNATTGIETCALVVIKGNPSTTSPSDPAYTSGDIMGGNALVNDMPLYRVPFDGLNMQPLVCLFETIPNIVSQYEVLKQKIEDAISAITESGILDTLEEIDANTMAGKIAGALAVKALHVEFNDTLKWYVDNGFIPAYDKNMIYILNHSDKNGITYKMTSMGGSGTTATLTPTANGIEMSFRNATNVAVGGFVTETPIDLTAYKKIRFKFKLSTIATLNDQGSKFGVGKTNAYNVFDASTEMDFGLDYVDVDIASLTGMHYIKNFYSMGANAVYGQENKLVVNSIALFTA